MGDWWARMCCHCLLKWARYHRVREGSGWGLPRGREVVWCAVGACGHSLVWPHGTREGKMSEWKRHPTQSTRNGPWASRFCSASEKRVCCSEACPFKWPVKTSLCTCGELKWPMAGGSIIHRQFLISWTAAATEYICRTLSSEQDCPENAKYFTVSPSLTSLRKKIFSFLE